jgi:hypothetical protein
MQTGAASKHRRGTTYPQSELPLWNHPSSIQVVAWNCQVEREMAVTKAPTPTHLWSSSRWLALDAEQVVVEPPTLDPTATQNPGVGGIRVSRRLKVNPS